MIASERLKQLSGLSGVSSSEMLVAIGSGVTAGDRLVNYSGATGITAAQHLMTDVLNAVESVILTIFRRRSRR